MLNLGKTIFHLQIPYQLSKYIVLGLLCSLFISIVPVNAQDDTHTTYLAWSNHLAVTIPSDWGFVERDDLAVGVSPSQSTLDIFSNEGDYSAENAPLLGVVIDRVTTVFPFSIQDQNFHEFMKERMTRTEGVEIIEGIVDDSQTILFSVPASDTSTGTRIVYMQVVNNWLIFGSVILQADDPVLKQQIYHILASIEVVNPPAIVGDTVWHEPLALTEFGGIATNSQAEIFATGLNSSESRGFIYDSNGVLLDERDYPLTHLFATDEFVVGLDQDNSHLLRSFDSAGKDAFYFTFENPIEVKDLALDVDGDIWLLLFMHNAVESLMLAEFNQNGDELIRFPLNEYVDPGAILGQSHSSYNFTIHGDKIYVAIAQQVYVFDASGEFVADNILEEIPTWDYITDITASSTSDTLYISLDLGIILKYNLTNHNYVESRLLLTSADEELIALTYLADDQVGGVLKDYVSDEITLFTYDFAE